NSIGGHRDRHFYGCRSRRQYLEKSRMIMNEYVGFAITVFMGFFAIMNPISNLSVFLNLTDGADEETKKRINKKAIFTAFTVVVVFMLLGEIIFNIFGITLPAFKITGGVLVFLVGFD